MRPAFFLPQPSVRAIEPSAWPGTIHAAAVIDRSPTEILRTSWLLTPRPRAVAGDRIAALSQTSFVTGSGISWSHVLLAWRPSTIFGHGANVTSREPAPVAGGRRRLSIAAATSLKRGGAPGPAGGALMVSPVASPRFQSRSRSVTRTGTTAPDASWHSSFPSPAGAQSLSPRAANVRARTVS